MAARDQKVEIWSGDTVRIRFKVVDREGLPVVLTDPSAVWSVRKTAKQGESALIERSTIDEKFFFETIDGVTHLVVRLSESDTIDMEPGAYYQEATVFDGEFRSTIATGPFVIQASMNRRPVP